MWKRKKKKGLKNTGEAKAQNVNVQTFQRDDRRSLKSLLAFFSLLFNFCLLFSPLFCLDNVVSSMDLNPWFLIYQI